MKKLALILAIAFIAAFAAPAMASDFMAGGQARYEAVHNDFEDDSDEDYFDQRYRVAFTWKVNDNVTTQLRADFAEDKWGQGYRYEEGHSTIMVDRAWVKINQGILTLTVGQQANSLAHGLIWSDQFTGAVANLDFMPVYINALYTKEYEGDKDSDDDEDIWGGQIGFAGEGFDISATYVANNDDDSDSDTVGYGVDFSTSFAGFALKGGAAMFDGDTGGSADYAGTQAFVDFGGALSDTFKFGLTFIWADEVDSDEVQVTNIEDDLGWNYTDYGGKLGYNNGLKKGTWIFNPAGEDEGAIGGVVRLSLAPMDNLTFYGKVGYVAPSGDDDDYESTMFANASVDWVWMPAVTVSGGVFWYDEEWDDSSDDEETLQGTVQLTVAF